MPRELMSKIFILLMFTGESERSTGNIAESHHDYQPTVSQSSQHNQISNTSSLSSNTPPNPSTPVCNDFEVQKTRILL